MRSFPSRRFRFLGLLIFTLGGVGCSYIPETWIWSGATGPSGTAPVHSPEALRSRANSELLSEVYRVVFLKEPADRAWFGGFVDTMNQGASIEGIYNGWIRGSDYRLRESEKQAAPPKAVAAFARELALIESDLEHTRVFKAEDSRPPVLLGAEAPVAPSEAPTESSEAAAFGKPLDIAELPKARTAVDASSLAAKYEVLFLTSNFFTLKRVLGEEAIRLVNEKSVKAGALPDWYATWAVALSARGVDYGLEQRNRPDFQFHRQWAEQAGADRLTWEVLNRLHRVLNSTL